MKDPPPELKKTNKKKKQKKKKNLQICSQLKRILCRCTLQRLHKKATEKPSKSHKQKPQPTSDTRRKRKSDYRAAQSKNILGPPSKDHPKWRSLIRKGADNYEAKRAQRVCKTEQKRKENKARAKRSSAGSSSSEMNRSTCNRQFRAKIYLISHQRTSMNCKHLCRNLKCENSYKCKNCHKCVKKKLR